jgi:hypothetical protein
MDWDRVDSTVRELFRMNGRSIGERHGRTPLSDLIAKDPMPPLSEMTAAQLCEFASDHHIAIEDGLERWEIIETIKEALEKNWDERVKGMRAVLDYVAKDGPHPLSIVRNFCGVVKAVRPQCILNASLAQLAVLCADGRGGSSDGRATQSARIKRLFEEPIRKAGMIGCKASFQKSDSACRNYSASAEGNKNRLGSGYLALKQERTVE